MAPAKTENNSNGNDDHPSTSSVQTKHLIDSCLHLQHLIYYTPNTFQFTENNSMLSLQYLNENMLFRGTMALRGPGSRGGDEVQVLEVVAEEERHGHNRMDTKSTNSVRKRKREFIAKTSLSKTRGTCARSNGTSTTNIHNKLIHHQRSKLVKDGVSEYTYWFGEFAFVVKEQDFWIVHTEHDIWCDWLKNVVVRDVEGNTSEELTNLLVDEPKFDFKLHPSGDMIAFICCADIYVIPLQKVRQELIQKSDIINERMKKLCSNHKRVKTDDDSDGDFLSSNEVILHNPVVIHKITKKDHEDHLNGIADYLMSEEFNRQTGYWWQPTRSVNPNSGVTQYQIAYLSVDESNVPQIKLPQEGISFDVDSYRYPLSGESNPVTTLCIATFTGDATQAPLTQPLRDLFTEHLPWVEYVCTVGWLADGERIWMQVLDRAQQHFAFVLVDPTNSPRFTILKEIKRPNGWVNVVHEVYPFQQDPTLLLITLQNPETHLYLFKLNPREYSLNSVRQLTHGAWNVIQDSPLYVDEYREVVYFRANYGDLLEHHVFGLSFARGNMAPPARLTPQGHSVLEYHFNATCTKFVCTFSSIETVPQCITFELQEYAGEGDVPQFVPTLQYNYSAPSLNTLYPYTMSIPQLFSFDNGHGEILMGAVFKPVNYDPNKSYPCIVSNYSGPNFALVHRSFALTSNGRNQLFCNRGFCVLVIDGRGSAHRGYEFETCFKDRLCQFEHEDTIMAVQHVKTTSDSRVHVNIDMDRVGIFGWSYGGSVALHAIAKRGDFFRCAACVSPVVVWQLYSTAYTERYMGFPHDNEEAYSKSCGLECVPHLPDEEGRLLLCHGMSDSNVFFKHTELLLEQLNEVCKPYRLCIYPGCSHSLSQGVRHLTRSLLSFFEESLKKRQ